MKNLLIIEDVAIGDASKDLRKLVDRSFGYCSTHKSVSVIATAQNFISIPQTVRRMATVFCLWRTADIVSMRTMAERVGLDAKQFMELCRQQLTNRHEFLTVDLTNDSPAPMRKGLLIPLNPDPRSEIDRAIAEFHGAADPAPALKLGAARA